MSISDSTTLTYLGQANKWNTAADGEFLVYSLDTFPRCVLIRCEERSIHI